MKRPQSDSFLRRLGRLRRHESGMAAVEFSLILPILVLLWIGGVELTQGLSVDRKLNGLNAAIGDLSSRSKTLLYQDVDAIFDIGPGALFPYATTSLKMRVTAVDMDGSGTGKVAWSRAEGTGITAYAVNTSMNSIVPATLRVANSQVIMAEVYYTYSPAVGYLITGNVALDDRLFYVPRLVDKVKLCDNAGANCQS